MLSRYRGKTKCNSCKGKRLRPEANYIKIGGKTISDLVDLDYTEAVSNMMQQTLQLQAAIAAFQQTSNLSLFNS